MNFRFEVLYNCHIPKIELFVHAVSKGSLPYREIVARMNVRIIYAPEIPLALVLAPGADGVIGGSNKH